MTTPSSRFSRNLSLVALAPLALGLLVIAMGVAMAAPAPKNRHNDQPQVIVRHADRHPADAHAAGRLYQRLEAAALEACGGGAHSFPELNRSIRASTCWRQAMNGALAQVDTSHLALAGNQGQ
jgi:UrcA family protein